MKKIKSIFLLTFTASFLMLFLQNSSYVEADHCGAGNAETCTGAANDYKCSTGELTGCDCMDCSSGGSGGGGIPPDKTVTSNGKNVPVATCGPYDSATKTNPIVWQWSSSRVVHLQVYDSTGAWWFNNWIKSNAYVTSTTQKPGTITYARVSYDGAYFSPVGEASCLIKKTR